MKKRILSLLCVFCLMLTMLPTNAFAAVYDAPTLSIEATYNNADGTVEAKVIVGACTDLAGIDFHLKFNKEKLTVKEKTTNPKFGTGANLVVAVNDDYVGLAANPDNVTTTSNETILTVVFNVIAGKSGNVEFSFDETVTNFVDSTGDNTADAPGAGSVTSANVTIPKAPITSVTIADLEAPVKGGTPDTSVTVTPSGLVADVKWFDGETQVTGNFAASTKYTVKIKLTASGGDNFAETVTAGGYTVTRNSETELLLTKTFPETDEKTLRGIDIITNPALEVAVPTAAPNATATNERSLAVTGVYDDGSGGPVAVNWEITTTPIPKGVSLVGSTLKVTNEAEAGTFRIKATSADGYTDAETVTITKAALATTAIVATAPTKGTDITIPNGGTTTSGQCSYKVYDQYGAEMTGTIADWKMKLDPATVTGVSLISANGSISVTNKATTCKATLYAESGGVKSNEITFNIARAASVATSLTIDGSADSVTVPTVSEPGTTECRYAAYTAKVKDQYGAEMTGQTIAWSVTQNPGVAINNGQLTVTNKATAGDVTITAKSGTLNATKTVTINKAAEKATLVEIYDQVGGTPETRLLIPAGTGTKDVDYTAKVYDQYGVHMPGEMVHWALDPAMVTGVELDATSIPGSATLKVDNSATSGTTFKLKATTATPGTTGVKELDITVQKKNDVNGKINFNDGSLTYNGEGRKYENAALDNSVTAGTGGAWTYTYAVKSGTGTLDAAGLPKTVGTYTVTATYEDSSNIGSKSVTLTITPKKVNIPAPDTTVYTYDGTAKTYQISASADYTVNNATQTNANEAGHIVTVTLKDSTNTTWEDDSVDQKIFIFKIMKATPTGAPSYTKITAAGKTLADADLKTDTITPSGTIKWVEDDGTTVLPDTTPVAKNKAYKWLFTPTDAGNYKTLTGSLTPYYVASSGGGSYVPTVQKPEITIIGSGKADLSADGRTATITAAAGHELVSVVLNGKEMGKVEKLTGLKTGDKATITFRAKTDGKAEMDKIIAQKASKLTLMARSQKTAKLNIKVVVKGDLKAITDAGYTVKYKFYRSTKKSAGYKAVLTKKAPTYYNTYGKKGTMYYYKARVMIYDKNGNFVAQTALKQCKYANRLWTK